MYKLLIAVFIIWLPGVSEATTYYEMNDVYIGKITTYPERGTMTLFRKNATATSGGCPDTTGNPFYMPGAVPTVMSEITSIPQESDSVASLAIMAYSNQWKVNIVYSIPFLNRCVIHSITYSQQN